MDKQYKHLMKRVRVKGVLIFDTAFHIGSGHEGILATKMGVLLDQFDRPILPGSSLKGNFRSAAERLAVHLGMTACLLDKDLSGVPCITDNTYRQEHHETFKALSNETQKLAWLRDHTCEVCRLFGSPYQGSRIYFSDGVLLEGGESIQVRDGVCIDRDSGTAVDKMKYDFEVVSKDTVYDVTIDLENPADEELALVGAVIAEWEQGFRVGGFTSRGLGRVNLTKTGISQVNYEDREQLKKYLLKKEMTAAPDLLQECIERHLAGKGATNA